MSATLKVLIVLTSHAQVEVASSKGGRAPIDPRSLQAEAGKAAELAIEVARKAR